MTVSAPEIEFLRRERASADSLTEIARVDFVEPNLNLLAHAQTIELDVGSRCGGHGKCGGDRVRVLPSAAGEPAPALSAVTEAERRHLTEAEIASGFRLACQCFPDDATVSIRLEIG